MLESIIASVQSVITFYANNWAWITGIVIAVGSLMFIDYCDASEYDYE